MQLKTGGGGTHLEKVYKDVRSLTPFHTISAVPLDPHFSMLQFFKPPFSTKITNFTKFAVLEPKFPFQNSNLAKI